MGRVSEGKVATCGAIEGLHDYQVSMQDAEKRETDRGRTGGSLQVFRAGELGRGSYLQRRGARVLSLGSGE
jgi:hypothetical protein